MSKQTLTLEEIQNFSGKYPKQLWSLFTVEMWERFCFYGMRGMLTVFMASQLGLTDKAANLQYGAIQAFVYAFTFIGGLFADKILGFRKSLFWGALLMVAGGFIIAVSPEQFFYIGICFSIVGTGFFKPNISSMVGQLYKDGDSRRDAGFSLFYAGINLGATLGGLLMVWVGLHVSWSLAFALVGVVMTISLITFYFTQHSMGPIGFAPIKELGSASRARMLEIGTYIGSLLILPLILILVKNSNYTDMVMYVVGPAALLYVFYEMTKYSVDERKKLFAALLFIIFSIFFWAFFEQSGGSLALFAYNNLHDSLLGIKGIDPNVVNNTANSIFVIAFAAPLGMLWIWLAKRKKEPSASVKFGLGFLLLGLAFFIFYSTIHFADANGLTSLEIFTLGYFVITFGELCLSPIGLSLMTKLSPAPMQGLMMGMWFLASAYGQYVAGLLGAGMSTADENATAMDKLVSYTNGYQQLAIYALVAGVVLIIISPMIKRLMGTTK